MTAAVSTVWPTTVSGEGALRTLAELSQPASTIMTNICMTGSLKRKKAAIFVAHQSSDVVMAPTVKRPAQASGVSVLWPPAAPVRSVNRCARASRAAVVAATRAISAAKPGQPVRSRQTS